MIKKIARKKFGSKKDLLIVFIIAIYIVINIKLIFINNELLVSGKEEVIVNIEGLYIFKIFVVSTIILFFALILFKNIHRYIKVNKQNKGKKKSSKDSKFINSIRKFHISKNKNKVHKVNKKIEIKSNAS